MLDFLTWSFAVAASAVMLAGVVRGFAGFGSAMVMTPILSALYSPVVAVPMGLVLEMLLTVPFLPGAAPLVDWRRIGALSLAACVTVPAGAWLLLSLDPLVMRWAISAIVLGFVAILAFGWRYHGHPKPLATLVTGAASGVLSGASGMSGPPIIFYFLSGPGAAGQARASFIIYFALIDIATGGVLWLHGALPMTIVLQALLLTPFYLAAAWLGARLFRGAGDGLYRKVALAVLTLVAVSSLVL